LSKLVKPIYGGEEQGWQPAIEERTPKGGGEEEQMYVQVRRQLMRKY
jgi:hypothetical protein